MLHLVIFIFKITKNCILQILKIQLGKTRVRNRDTDGDVWPVVPSIKYTDSLYRH